MINKIKQNQNLITVVVLIIFLLSPDFLLGVAIIIIWHVVVYVLIMVAMMLRSLHVFVWIVWIDMNWVYEKLSLLKTIIWDLEKMAYTKGLELLNKYQFTHYIIYGLFVLKFVINPFLIVFLLVAIFGISIFLDVDDKTFRFGLNRIFYKLIPTDNIRLNINLPIENNKTAYESKSNLLKKLYELANIKPSSGTFVPVWWIFNFRGYAIIEGIFQSYKSRTIKFSVGISKKNDMSNIFIDIPKERENEIRTYLTSNYKGIAISSGTITKGECIKGHLAGDWRKRIKTEKDDEEKNVNDIFQSIVSRLEMVKGDIEIKYDLIPLTAHYNRIVNRTYERLALGENIAGSALNSDEAMYQNIGANELFAFEVSIIGDNYTSNLELSKVFNVVKYQRGCYMDFSSGRNPKESIVSLDELYTLWHLEVNLGRSVDSKSIVYPYPAEFIPVKKFYLEMGESNQSGFEGKKVGYEKPVDMDYHTRIIAPPGAGKSNLLKKIGGNAAKDNNLPIFLLEYSKKGTTAIDFHNYIPKKRLKDIVYLQPREFDIPMSGFEKNMDRDTALEDMAFMVNLNSKQYLKDSYGNRLDNNLHALIKFISKTCDPTFRDISKTIKSILDDPQILNQLTVSDDELVSNTASILGNLSKSRRAEFLESLSNNIGKFTGNNRRRINLCSTNTKLSFVDCIRENKIVIINLAKLKGTEKFAFGIFYAYKIHQAINEMMAIDPDKRCLVILEEAQNILNAMSEQFIEDLGENRGLKAGYVMAHHYFKQISEDLNDALNTFARNQIYLGGSDDEEIELVAKSLGEDTKTFNSERIKQMPLGSGIARLKFRDTVTKPFSFVTEEVKKLNNVPLTEMIEQTKRLYWVDQPTEKVSIKTFVNNYSKDDSF